ncbi:MAG: hypothetical protein JW929_04280 [Anaerolineales bacterium]|nr:hypothetical protein [Anaerolineales bacterium]
MRRHSSSVRILLVLLAGWALTACVCSIHSALLDKPTTGGKPAAETSPAAATNTRARLETRLGEPYLVASFPSGAEIRLFSPGEDEVVSDPWVDVIGAAPAETVITLNEEIAVAGADGMFSARVPLEEGLNEILCVASDLEGNEVAFAVIVVYEPDTE